MPSFSRNDVVLVRYPFSDASAGKVRPAIIVGILAPLADFVIVPLTSRTDRLAAGEFILKDWRGAGLNLPSAVKRGLYTIHEHLILKGLGRLTIDDSDEVDRSLRVWLNLS